MNHIEKPEKSPEVPLSHTDEVEALQAKVDALQQRLNNLKDVDETAMDTMDKGLGALGEDLDVALTDFDAYTKRVSLDYLAVYDYEAELIGNHTLIVNLPNVAKVKFVRGENERWEYQHDESNPIQFNVISRRIELKISMRDIANTAGSVLLNYRDDLEKKPNQAQAKVANFNIESGDEEIL